MPVIKVEMSDFGGRPKSQKNLNVSWLQFLKYGMTAGMPLFGGSGVHAFHALSLAVYKAIGITCALDFSGLEVTRSQSLPNLDPTEQANLSTWVGMCGAAIAADKLLGVSQLLHAGALYKNGKLTANNSNSRRLADLVGQNSAKEWHVIEAKARQRNPSKKERNDWKIQAQTVGTIEGHPPATQSYCYTRINDPCKVELCNQIPKHQKVKLELTDGAFGLMDIYYQVLMDVLQDAREIHLSNHCVRFTLAGFDPAVKRYIHVGLDCEVYNKVYQIHNFLMRFHDQGGSDKELHKEVMREYMPPRIESVDEEDVYMASDGVVVVASEYQRIERDNRYH
jgi:hypothetical protein